MEMGRHPQGHSTYARDFSDVQKEEAREILGKRYFLFPQGCLEGDENCSDKLEDLRNHLFQKGYDGEADEYMDAVIRCISKEEHKLILQRLKQEKDSLNAIIQRFKNIRFENHGYNPDDVQRIADCVNSLAEKFDQGSARDFINRCLNTKALERLARQGFWGLSLSGGGIRSASFSMGVLQGLEESGKLEAIDYISSVSGGGYASCGYIYQAHHQGGRFPFSRQHGEDGVARIRRHARYLNPGKGLDMWAFAVAAARGVLLNLALILPLLAIFLNILKIHFNFNIGGNLLKPLILTALAWLSFAIWRCSHGRKILYSQHSDACVGLIASVFLTGLLFVLCPGVIMALLFLVFLTGLLFTFCQWVLQIPFGVCSISLFAIFVPLYIIAHHFCSKASARKPKKSMEKKIALSGLEPLSWLLTLLGMVDIYARFTLPASSSLAAAFMGMGLALLLKLVIDNIFYAYLSASSLRLREGGHQYFTIQSGDLAKLGILLLAISLIPLVHEKAMSLSQTLSLDVGALESLLGTLGALLSMLGALFRWRIDERRPWMRAILYTGSGLILLGVILFVYGLVPKHLPSARILIPGCVIWLLAVAVFDINYISMHRYYRNRLMETFFSKNNPKCRSLQQSQSDNLDLQAIDIGCSRTPFPIINAMIETHGSKQAKYANRGGDSFFFTPKRIGSQATGWQQARAERYRRLNLATVMAISGAAIDPLIGFTRSRPLGILMTLLNFRLGYWIVNPNHTDDKPDASGQSPQRNCVKDIKMCMKNAITKLLPVSWHFADEAYRREGVPTPPMTAHSFSIRMKELFYESWVYLVFKEMFSDLEENDPMVRLTDGGHFENLGLYELVRRRCRTIIAVDASCDPEWRFDDLARLCERVRVDFGAEVEINTEDFQRSRKTGMALKPYVEGTIRYPGGAPNSRLIYIKATLFLDLPEDVLGYHRRHKKFPHQPTTDQFYDEEQFEAYRELGYRAALEMVASSQLSLEGV